MSYRIELAGNRYKPQQVTSLYLITAFALLGTGALTFMLGNADWIKKVFHQPVVPAAVTGSISILYALILFYLCFRRSNLLLQAQYNRLFRILNTIITATLAVVFLLSQWWLAAGICGLVAAANLFAFFYEQKARAPLFVTFEESAIYLPATSRRKQLEWMEVERVLLRHGTVTIDCSNNFLYQWNTKNKEQDAAGLEAFCRQLIEKNRSKRDANDW